MYYVIHQHSLQELFKNKLTYLLANTSCILVSRLSTVSKFNISSVFYFCLSVCLSALFVCLN